MPEERPRPRHLESSEDLNPRDTDPNCDSIAPNAQDGSDESIDDSGSHPAYDSLVGTVLGDRYEIISELGHGGMGVVYKAKHKLINRILAIKVLNTPLLRDPISKKRFTQEAVAASSLDHPNLITVFDYGFAPKGEPYLVMNFIDGRSLDEVLEQEGPLNLERFLHVFDQVCKALQYVHKQNLIHRDIKPSNIMLLKTDDDDSFVKLVDFGIAKSLPQDGRSIERLTATGNVFGSPLYMSPEQCMGKTVDVRSDVYSLGCVMYEMLMGVPPLEGENPLQTLFRHVNDHPLPMAQLENVPKVPAKLDDIVLKSLKKDPSERYQSVSEFGEALKGFAELEAWGGRENVPRETDHKGTTHDGPPKADIESTDKGRDLQKSKAERKLNKAPILPFRYAIAAVITGVAVTLGVFWTRPFNNTEHNRQVANSSRETDFNRQQTNTEHLSESNKKDDAATASSASSAPPNPNSSATTSDNQQSDSKTAAMRSQLESEIRAADDQYDHANFGPAALIYAQVLNDTKKYLGDLAYTHVLCRKTIAQFSPQGGSVEEFFAPCIKECESISSHANTFDPWYPQALSDLGDIYLRCRKYDAAEPLYKQALRLRIDKYGERSLLTQDAEDNLARLYRNAGVASNQQDKKTKYLSQALQYYRKALITLDDFPRESVRLARVKLGLFSCLCEQGNFQQAAAIEDETKRTTKDANAKNLTSALEKLEGKYGDQLRQAGVASVPGPLKHRPAQVPPPRIRRSIFGNQPQTDDLFHGR